MNQNSRPTAIVTGAARGIGAGIAERLAAQGHPIAVVDLDLEAARAQANRICESGGRATAYQVDVSVEQQVDETVELIANELGAPLVLVNNAGNIRDNLVFKMSVDDWESVMGVHLRGAFLMSRATQRFMTKASYGRIVNLSSTSALGNRGQANYSAAKAGLQGLTKTLAIELGRFGITVNSVAPGFIRTEMTEATAARIGLPFDEFAADVIASIPVGRVGEPKDIGNAVSFLIHEDSSFVSGQVLYVAGGPRA